MFECVTEWKWGRYFLCKGILRDHSADFSACVQGRQKWNTCNSNTSGSSGACQSELGEGQGLCESKRQRRQSPFLQTRGYSPHIDTHVVSPLLEGDDAPSAELFKGGSVLKHKHVQCTFSVRLKCIFMQSIETTANGLNGHYI